MNLTINMGDSSQLLKLGFVAFGLVNYPRTEIVVNKQMAVICHLFATLCHEIGLQNIYLLLVEQIENRSLFCNKYDESAGCTGIITERSDMESALDVFLTSTSTSHWSLKLIFVQESIYEAFKEVMKWKCKKNSNGDLQNQFQHDIYKHDAKKFVLGAFDAEIDAAAHIVRVEAYRTTKELLSLMAECEPDYVSLWASDHAEANEIAHGVNCKVVWVNDFGTFQGPAEVSNAVYQDGFGKHYINEIPVSWSESSKAWEKLSMEKRQQIMLESLGNVDMNDEWREFINLLKCKIKLCRNGFLDSSKSTMCIGIQKPVGMLCLNFTNLRSHILESIASLSYGNVAVIKSKMYNEYKYVLDLLIESHVPVFIGGLDVSEDDVHSIKCNTRFDDKYFTVTKIIWMNFGTIFAN